NHTKRKLFGENNNKSIFIYSDLQKKTSFKSQLYNNHLRVNTTKNNNKTPFILSSNAMQIATSKYIYTKLNQYRVKFRISRKNKISW
ncbi:hypothetical protein, partial [Citrobacter freundii]|uniref:hypothetical protein n=1 Tax=Citrobacter freundii TaxID=546 RepID=UPI001F14B591